MTVPATVAGTGPLNRNKENTEQRRSSYEDKLGTLDKLLRTLESGSQLGSKFQTIRSIRQLTVWILRSWFMFSVPFLLRSFYLHVMFIYARDVREFDEVGANFYSERDIYIYYWGGVCGAVAAA